jgi:hypothetical protein
METPIGEGIRGHMTNKRNRNEMSKSFFLLLILSALILWSSLPAASQDLQKIPPTPPAYCHPCLFYGGDFDPHNKEANSLANELTTAVVSGARVFVPFIVPAGKTWTVTALFSNNLSYVDVIDPQEGLWSISKGMSQGNGGTIIADGAAPATYVATGRHGFGQTEYTLMLTIDPPVKLKAGLYWMTAIPECKNPVDRACASASYYLSDVEDVPRKHSVGREPDDRSWYFSGEFGYFYYPTWGTNGACQGTGCDRFSAGAVGKESSE